MPKYVNNTLEVMTSGLEVVAIYCVGAAPFAPIVKLVLTLVPLAIAAVRSLFKSKDEKDQYHV